MNITEEHLKKKISYISYWKDWISDIGPIIGRLPTREVSISDLKIGFPHPIVIQSMTLTDAKDIEGSVQEVLSLWRAGAQMVRITVPSIESAKALKEIKEKLLRVGCKIPIVADIHYTPNAALIAAQFVEKVRINPGNYVDKKTLSVKEYTYSEYTAELEKVREKFIPLIRVCKEYGRALRIGVNHGSLSDRIMNVFGDTPEGMVHSAMEFVEICREENFHNIVISMKASNPIVMVKAYRLLAAAMLKNGWLYPIHLGVTEAGNSVEGRMKSAIGIGTLLLEGIGDTIRVSLTEPPVNEIPVCKQILDYVYSNANSCLTFSPKRLLDEPSLSEFVWIGVENGIKPDFISIGNNYVVNSTTGEKFVVKEMEEIRGNVKLYYICSQENSENLLGTLLELSPDISYYDIRFAISEAKQKVSDKKLILKKVYNKYNDINELSVQLAMDFGSFLIDRLIDGLWIEFKNNDFAGNSLVAALLQCARIKITRTEFIACPGCGRTLFNLEDTTNKIKEAIGHLPGIKIAIMGCIVNGLGEMADADYGYIGSGHGKISLYRGKECVAKNIDEDSAVERLIEIIKKDGKWRDKQS